MTDLIIPSLKRCPKCEQDKPATPEYFSRHHKAPDGLNWWCKMCLADYQRQYRKTEHGAEKQRQYRDNDGARTYHREYYHTKKTPESLKRKREYAVRRYHANPDVQHRMCEYNRKPERKAYAREYAQRPEVKLRNKTTQQQYRRTEARRAYNRNYNRSWRKHPDSQKKLRVYYHRRRARKLALPDTFTFQEWQLCLDYFHHTCAVCGHQLRDLFGQVKPHADHWIALTDPRLDNPGTVPDNMICLCSVCNNNKKNKDPEQWLIRLYGKRKAAQIIQRIEIYFDWTKTRNRKEI